MLKVIAGTARGRQLKTLPKEDFSIRPMLGMMKKSVFDIITPVLPDSLFLDLYAGVGSVGIEALSRGAKRVVFAEISDKSISLVKYNLKMLQLEDKADIIKCDVIKGFPKFQNKYDIIFLGPPYKDGAKNALALTYPTLKNIVLPISLCTTVKDPPSWTLTTHTQWISCRFPWDSTLQKADITTFFNT